MQFSIDQKVFLEGLSKIQGIVGRKTNFPITANVKIDAQGDGISLESTDLEIGFRGQYEAQVQTPGSMTIPGKKLFEIVREFPTKTVKCTTQENGWVDISDTSVQYQLVGMDPEDFPKLPEVSDTAYFSMESQALYSMIERVNLSGALAAEEKRPHLIGVFLQNATNDEKAGLRMVSTDGNRLAKVEGLLEQAPEVPGLAPGEGVILPKKVMAELLKLTETAGPVQLGIQGNYFVVNKANETLIGRLVEGAYPDYEMVIPKGIETFFQVQKDPFLSTLRRMMILRTEKYRAVRFTVENNKLVVSIINPEIGESKEEVPISFGGESFNAAFNPRFFSDALGVMKSDELTVTIESDQKPCIVTGKEDPDFLTVIMPMRM